jgi:ParB family chromosome partitioning protein
MAVKKGLGKGLDIMIPEKIVEYTEGNDGNVSRETMIRISDIEPNKSQPRKKFDEDSLQELADSIKQYGVIQPLILQKRGKYYDIIAGERRWRAARLAGLKEVPAIIKDYTPQEVVEIALIENIQREDLNPIEEAQTYQRLIQEFHLKQDEVAERVSKSRVAVTNSMRLLKLDERIQQMIIDDMISSGHARALLAIEDKEKQYHLACKIFDEKLSVRETEKLVKQTMKDAPIREAAVTVEENYIYRNLEDKIRGIIGTKVSIHKKNKNKGIIEIEYYSNEELERIVDLFDSMNEK